LVLAMRVERVIERVVIEPDEFIRAFGLEGWELIDAKVTADGKLLVEISRRP